MTKSKCYFGKTAYIHRLLAMAHQRAGQQDIALNLWKSVYDTAETHLERKLAKKFLIHLAIEILDVSEDSSLRERAKEIVGNLTR